MKRIPFLIVFLVIFLTPALTLGEEGKCIEGDCLDGQGTKVYNEGVKYVGKFGMGKNTVKEP